MKRGGFFFEAQNPSDNRVYLIGCLIGLGSLIKWGVFDCFCVGFYMGVGILVGLIGSGMELDVRTCARKKKRKKGEKERDCFFFFFLWDPFYFLLL